MPDTVIKSENLGKKYLIGHQAESQGSYVALRDVIARNARLLWRSAKDVVRGRPIIVGDETEEVWALKGVDFEVKRGEVLGVIGRNGAGKSTLLKVLSRITEPSEGRVTIRGRVASLLEVGTGFHPELTGRENVFLNGAILGMTRAEIRSKYAEIVDFAGVEKYIDTPVKRYSSGMRVRLAFAVAAHLEPEILLVDEVLAVGDAEFQKKCLGKMKDVAGHGRTVLFVSHNMGAVRRLCPQAILFDSGKLCKFGPAEEVIAEYMGSQESVVGGERVWADDEMPGDGTARIRGLRVCDANGEVRTEFGTTEPVCLEVEHEIYEPVRHFRIGVSVYAADGTYVFYTSDADVPERFSRTREPGAYVSRCAIPGHLLNTGTYSAVVGGGLYNVRTIFKDVPELKFRVFSTGGALDTFTENRPGLVAPDIPWTVAALPQHARIP